MNPLFPFFLPLLLILMMFFEKNYHNSNIDISIAHVFTAFLNNLSGKNHLLPQHVINPSAVQDLLQKETLFDLPNIEQLRTIENNPHHSLVTGHLQIHHFQYQFFQNLTLNTNTKEQIRISYLFLKKFFFKITTNMFGTLNFKMPVLFSHHRSLKMNSYRFFPPLTIVILNSNISLLFQLLILHTLHMIIIALIKVLIFHLLLDHLHYILLYLLLLTQPLKFLYKSFLFL